MLLIRDAQLVPFGDEARQRFTEQLTEIMASDFTVHVTTLGRPAFDKVVLEAITQAEGFGLRTLGAITDYVCTVLCCGEHFHTQPAYSWADMLLRSKDPERARKVLDEVLARLGAQGGEHS
ncbi:hypothetical protein [Myxococcus qinghaiensis]|uniref:hypothetical protein n=1 Tax=Myxococcus qinghaiensis TaxID=2906758 RepID=UPI0020A7687A|nr:hypothetical protein [Myxococcus qinghaiensis]MCP3168502.1 hypothetical protein [Myxococcus qinghaiensis]